jgi:predicted transcriptional regulator
MAEVAEDTGMSLAAVALIVRELERTGLGRQEPPKERSFRLTPKGKRALRLWQAQKKEGGGA